MRHDTPHPKELKARHTKFLKQKDHIDGHVIPHKDKSDEVRLELSFVVDYRQERLERLESPVLVFVKSDYFVKTRPICNGYTCVKSADKDLDTHKCAVGPSTGICVYEQFGYAVIDR